MKYLVLTFEAAPLLFGVRVHFFFFFKAIICCRTSYYPGNFLEVIILVAE